MPWRASSVMEERLRFVARLLDGEAMTDVCREFGVSCKTGYKIFDRYREHGLAALSDRSRRPVCYANQLPPLDSTREDTAITAFRRLFRERGLPLAIRSDNGVPFAQSQC